jgi:hypothetical protein
VAEIKFYGTNGALQGKCIGTPGSWDNSTRTYDKAFDGDPATCFDAAWGIAWTGLDLGKPEQISEIHFLPRDVGNSVYNGHTYDLMYWGKHGWTSLGQQTATAYPLPYQVPANALLYLKDVTSGQASIYVFANQDGYQKWI